MPRWSTNCTSSLKKASGARNDYESVNFQEFGRTLWSRCGDLIFYATEFHNVRNTRSQGNLRWHLGYTMQNPCSVFLHVLLNSGSALCIELSSLLTRYDLNELLDLAYLDYFLWPQSLTCNSLHSSSLESTMRHCFSKVLISFYRIAIEIF